MKTRYIVSLVIASIAVVAGLAYYLYTIRASIQKVFVSTMNTVGDKFRNVKPRSVKVIEPSDILGGVEKDPKLIAELSDMSTRLILDESKTKDIVGNTRGTVKNESSTTRKKAAPFSQRIINATKYKKISDEKSASENYDKILRQIESEKAKSAVLLTATRAEKIRTQKLNIMKDLDMEIDVVSKSDAEVYVGRHV